MGRPVAVLLFAVALAASLLASPVEAQDRDPTVVVSRIQGRGGTSVRRVLTQILEEEGFEVLSTRSRRADDALGRIEGAVSRRRRRVELRLAIEVEGMALDPVVVSDRRPARVIRELPDALDPVLEELHRAADGPPEPPPVAAPSVEEVRAEPVAEPTPDAPPSDRAPGLVAIAEGGVVSRWLRFVDDIFGELPRHELQATPVFGARLGIYPGAYALDRGDALANLGMEIGYRRSAEVSSVRDDGLRFPTVYEALDIRAQARAWLGPHRLSAGLGYASRSLSVGPAAEDENQGPGVPRVRYESLDLTAELQLSVLPILDLRMGLSGRTALELGEIGSGTWFPNGTALGYGAELAVVVRPIEALRLEAGARFERFALTLRPDVDDPLIAGGASDDTLIVWMGAGAAL